MSVQEPVRIVLEIRRTPRTILPRGRAALRAGSVVFLCAEFMLVACGSALGAPAWLPAADLSAADRDATLPQATVDRQGDAVVVWQRDNGANTIVQAAARPEGGVWQAPVDLSAPGQNAVAPQLAVDAQGDATAVWQRFNGTDTIVQAAARPASGTWQTPVDVSAPGGDADEPRVAVNAHGDAVAVWRRSNGTNTIVQGAIRPAGGAWHAPVDLSSAGQNAVGPQVAIDPQGDATAVWQRPNGTNTVVQAAWLPGGGVWQAPVDLSAPGQDAVNPEVVLDAQGAATAVWQRSDGSADVVQAAIRPASGGWRAPVDLSVAGQPALYPQLAIDAQGNAAVVWQRFNGAHYVVQAAGYDAAGPQLRSASIPASGTAGLPLSFSVSPLDVWSAVASTGWVFGDGLGASGASVSHTYAAPGTYAVSVTSADTLANATRANREHRDH